MVLFGEPATIGKKRLSFRQHCVGILCVKSTINAACCLWLGLGLGFGLKLKSLKALTRARLDLTGRLLFVACLSGFGPG